jgi:hypothetical protein
MEAADRLPATAARLCHGRLRWIEGIDPFNRPKHSHFFGAFSPEVFPRFLGSLSKGFVG